MIDTLMDILKVLFAASPTILMCLGLKKLNLEKPYRIRQFLMPIFAFVYVLIIMIFSKQICDGLLGLIKAIPGWLGAIGNISWMPEWISGIMSYLSDGLKDLLNSLNLNFWIFYIANAAMVGAYLAFKKIVISILNAKFKDGGTLQDMIAGHFYEFFAERGVWCIKDSYVDARNLLNVFYFTAVAVSSLLMILSRWFYFNHLLGTVFFPVFGIIIVGEISFFLGGITRTEYSNVYLGEEEDSYRTVNYSLLRKFLRTMFGDKLDCENTTINSNFDSNYTNDELLEKLERDEDPKLATFGVYLRKLNQNGFKLDHNNVSSAVELLKGNNILFNNPFYYDLIPYAFYPMNRALLSHKKVLVVLGRHAIEDDIIRWLQAGIGAVTNIPEMWNISVLTEEYDEQTDIGIISRSDVLNMNLHEANAQFLRETGYFVIIEPSKLISTAQLGLNLIIKKCHEGEDNNIVFCMCDKNCDGLVDAMSHILMTSITEVSATGKHSGSSSYMCWNADDDYLHHRLLPNISRYLGIGTELSFAGLKNQVSRTTWYGGEVFPVTDISWIDRQYYYELMKYSGLPENQEYMDEVFVTSSGYWDATVSKNNYITVEDESCNMFEVVRDFSTRASEQGFVNVITREYMLKDYMSGNYSVFETDSKAIPYICADYARTNRNVTLRILLMMSVNGVSEDYIKKEFSLIGEELGDLKKQLWYEIYKCYADTTEISCFSDLGYSQAANAAFEKKITLPGLEPIDKDIISVKEDFNLEKGEYEKIYSLTNRDFISIYINDMKSAGYIAEDEKGDKYYLGSELKGHIYQKYLPGQFFTFGGKYYEMQYLTADNQVLVRRASDHITSRQSYRQVRNYKLLGFSNSEKIGSSRIISGIKVIKEYADICVSTSGYYRMSEYNNFKSAKLVTFAQNGGAIPDRLYKNKEIIRIEFPSDKNLTDRIRYTITLMLNEIFRTIFAENQPYIAAVTDIGFVDEDEDCKPLNYSLESECEDYNPQSIYIIEDSQLDLGLTIAVERNLDRIFEIINDYIEWHLSEMKNSLTGGDNEKRKSGVTDFSTDEDTDEDDDSGTEKKGIFRRIKDKLKKFFGKLFGRKKKKNKPDEETPEKPSDTDISDDNQTDEVPDGTDNNQTDEVPDGTDDNQTDEISDGTDEDTSDKETPSEESESDFSNPEENTIVTNIPPIQNCFRRKKKYPIAVEADVKNDEPMPEFFKKSPYHTRYYLLYGMNGEPGLLDIKGTGSFLSEVFYTEKNKLRQAREGRKIAKYIENHYRPNRANIRYCDFCGVEILGVEYETLADGRDRCINCSRTAVKTTDELIRIFDDVKRNMESAFGIKINVGIRVEMVNARYLQKQSGNSFTPSADFDPRVVGLAIKDKGGFRLLIENGAPRIRTILTIAHELTHIWQFQNWKKKDIIKIYGRNLELEIYEGMAKWAEIQYAYLINETAFAKREEITTAYRMDEYGWGFIRFRLNYPLTTGTVITGRTPFMDVKYPLSLDYCGSVSIPKEFLAVPSDADDNDDNDYSGLFGNSDDEADSDGETVFDGSHDRNPQAIEYYGYNHLSVSDREVYDIFLNAILNREEEVHLDDAHKMTAEHGCMIFHTVLNDHPELIWCSNSLSYYQGKGAENKDFFLKYVLDEEETQKRLNLIEEAVPSFLEGITDEMCDFEAVLRVYNNLISKVDYDSIGLEKQDKQRENGTFSGPDDLRSVYGTLVNRSGVCSGYAVAFQYLMHKIGIECLYVVGKVQKKGSKRFTESHAWNLLKLEGEYYYIDVTWGDYSNTKLEKNYSGEIAYNYFCITTEELEIDHRLDKEFSYCPVCTATACNYFVRTGLYLKKYDFERIKSITLKSVQNKNKSFEIRFENAEDFRLAHKELIENGKFYDILQAVNLKLGKTVNSSGYSYYKYEEKNIFKFVLKYIDF